MELELARAIVNEAVAGEFLDEVPETEEEIVEQAEYFAQEAEKAYNEGWGERNETVVAIVNLSRTEEPDKSPDQVQADSEAGTGSSAFFRGLPIPEGNNDNKPQFEMPFDVSALTDRDVRLYHGVFNHYFGRVRYHLAEEMAKLAAAEHIRDDAFRKAYEKLDKFDRQLDKAKSLKTLENEAMEDSQYVSWNRNVVEHEQNVIKLKALAEIYSKNVEVLSREATIRQNEYERSR